MADQKISQLPTITGANMATDDKFVLVDTSADATVATTRTEFFSNIPTITGNITSTGRVILTNAASSADTTNVSVGTLSGGFYANTPSGNAFYHAVAGNSITYNDDGLHWFKVSGTERLRVNSTGIVVAGTATSEELTVNRTGAVKSTLNFANAGTTYGQIHFNNVSPYDFSIMQQVSTGSIILGTNDTERMRIDTSGKLLIGDSSSQTADLLQIETPASGGGHGIQIRRNDSNSDQVVGTITFGNNTATDLASVLARTDGATDNGFLSFNTSASGGANTERMRIDSSGNVGIGNTSPQGRLHVNDSGTTIPTTGYGTGMMVSRTDGLMGTMFGFLNSPQSGYVQAANFTNSGNLPFLINPRGGNVGIGTDNPSNLLTLNRADNGIVAAFQKSGTTVGNISVVDSVTAYNTSSDYRLKTDAQPMTGATERVQELNPVNFEWISSGSRVDGFLAHEAQEVVPEAVTGERDGMRDEEYEVTPAVYEDVIIDAVEAVEATYDEEGLLLTEGTEGTPERTEQRLVTEAVITTRSVPDYQGIDQSKLVPLLTAALQEALTKIDSMEERLTALEE